MSPDGEQGLAEDVLRAEAPHVLAALVRRYGNFHLAEEAVQDALLEAVTTWTPDTTPAHPRGWLIRVAQRRLTDALRSEYSRAEREERYVRGASVTPGAGTVGARAGREEDPVAPDEAPAHDDSLELLFLCCHPSLSPASAVALTLRALGGLTTDEIASAFFVPSSTMGQRISRAKATVSGLEFDLDVHRADFGNRLSSVLTVLYLMFNEGYTTSGGERLTRIDLSGEAMRLTELVLSQLPDLAEVGGLAALQLLHEARRGTRELAGMPVALEDQDRSAWDRGLIARGVELLERALATGPPGLYQLQAAIAAVHCEAPTSAETDWPQILALYDVLVRLDPSPMVLVSRAVAVAKVRGPAAGLAVLDDLADDPVLARTHRVVAVRAHLLEALGRLDDAAAAFLDAARATRSQPEQRYLLSRAARCEDPSSPGSRWRGP